MLLIVHPVLPVLATLRRVELLDAEREEELDELVTEARRVMAETMKEGAE